MAATATEQTMRMAKLAVVSAPTICSTGASALGAPSMRNIFGDCGKLMASGVEMRTTGAGEGCELISGLGEELGLGFVGLELELGLGLVLAVGVGVVELLGAFVCGDKIGPTGAGVGALVGA